ncbi:hypothetical protein GCM10022226_69490 [Sphaerisporangium flaviroseum]|uniref:Histidine kinase/HSP90-like ATPase domain-containing protein n=1 Tax=Sphaerisporangium flaviroseum TaxID=509199 RepID=A0ABP7J897_9ACTN
MAPDTLRELCLPSSPESAVRARIEVRDWLGEDHPAYEPVRLAVSELVTNAVRHGVTGASLETVGATATAATATVPAVGAGGGAAEESLILRLSARDDRLRIEVTDTGSAVEGPHVLPDPAFLVAQDGRELAIVLPEGGRGLAIVDMLSAGHWGFHPNCDGPGRTVWCEIRAVPSALDGSRDEASVVLGRDI